MNVGLGRWRAHVLSRRHPLPFGCRIVPRFTGMDAEKLEQLIAASGA